MCEGVAQPRRPHRSITPLSTSSQAGATAKGQAAAATSASTSGTAASSTSAASVTGQTNPALGKANARIQAQIDATGAQLSSMGKLKSALPELQTGARALSASSSTTTVADAKAAVSRWVSAFNTSLAAAKSAATALAAGDPSGAKRAGNDLSRSLTANAGTLDALRKMGVKLQADGTLAADPAKLNANWTSDPSAVKAAMAKIGTALDQVSTKALASTGNVALSMASLNKKSSQLSTQPKAIQSFVEGSGSTSTTASSASATSGGYSSSSHASYALNAVKNNV